MTWREYRMAGFDLETTGVDPESDQIVTAVHGITTEKANSEGVDHKAGLAQIRDALYRAWALGAIVCGFNLAYDFTLLDRELRRYELGRLDVRGPIRDAHVIDKQVDPYRRGSRKLIDTCAHYGIHLAEDEAHGAESDALAATRLAWKLAGGDSRADLLPGDWQALNKWQAKAHREQRISFASYLRRQGKAREAAEAEARTAWPIESMRGGM